METFLSKLFDALKRQDMFGENVQINTTPFSGVVITIRVPLVYTATIRLSYNQYRVPENICISKHGEMNKQMLSLQPEQKSKFRIF